LTYGSEVWASEFIKLLKNPSSLDKLQIEQTHNKYCKYILGVPKRASNFAAKSELGRGPIFSFICYLVLKYCMKLTQIPASRILSNAFHSELNLHMQGHNSWFSLVAKLLSLSDQTSDAYDLTSLQHKLKLYTKNTIEILNNEYTNSAIKNIGTHSKLRTYIKFKKHFNLENYMLINDVPMSWKKLFSTIRLSCHDLEIERGRYSKNPKPPNERICKICKLEAETEKHFIITCPHYKSHRQDLFSLLEENNSMFKELTENDKFIFIMENKNFESLKLIMKYIHDIYEERKHFLLLN
jgi:hypothetical protein